MEWTTKMDRKNGFMTHIFSDKVKVITDCNTKITKVFHDGNIKRVLNNLSLDSYTFLLESTAREAATLTQFETPE